MNLKYKSLKGVHIRRYLSDMNTKGGDIRSYRQYLKRHSLSDSYKVHGGLSADYFFAL
jgi:hypothetical protein